jgi:hypothetical protein
MPGGADLPAAVADLTHLIFVAMPGRQNFASARILIARIPSGISGG